MRTKRLPFQCPVCEVRYTKKESLDSHIAEDHKGETIPKTKVKKLKVKKAEEHFATTAATTPVLGPPATPKRPSIGVLCTNEVQPCLCI